MKKIYAIMDARDEEDKAWVTEPIILENDVQASMAYTDFQKQLIKNHVKITDLRLYKIGEYDNDDIKTPLKMTEAKEIPVEIIGETENE